MFVCEFVFEFVFVLFWFYWFLVLVLWCCFFVCFCVCVFGLLDDEETERPTNDRGFCERTPRLPPSPHRDPSQLPLQLPQTLFTATVDDVGKAPF